MNNGWQKRHLLGIQGLSATEIEQILTTAASMKEVSQRPIKKVPTLRGKTVVNLFFEPSTRTRTSFEIAAKRLSADTINLTANTSSLTKGETLVDTARTLEAMAPDVIVVRHSVSGVPHLLARWVRCSVVNAGDGMNEHPTQALLDLMTVKERKGKIQGLKIAIVGDVAHSRVARSNIWGFTKMGASVRVAGPRTMLPLEIERLGVEAFDRVESAIEGVDIIMMLRLQLERQDGAYFPSTREYARFFGLDLQKLRQARPDVMIMHPGPIHRGIEIATEVADGPYSVILEQVANGVAIRMALLYLLLGQGNEDTNP
ncbi:MAG: aspartate carbamoyltransferase catalytic subunit [Deltaproteobacteria bacterium]|nr:aspartate carbamoyltransferase catalytic subunit [Deltaproteobacteria bacterium]